jgi:hypothetical protein
VELNKQNASFLEQSTQAEISTPELMQVWLAVLQENHTFEHHHRLVQMLVLS